jgi:hypothetical protein
MHHDAGLGAKAPVMVAGIEHIMTRIVPPPRLRRVALHRRKSQQ